MPKEVYGGHILKPKKAEEKQHMSLLCKTQKSILSQHDSVS